MQRDCLTAAAAAACATIATFPHLILAVDADRIAAGESTPLTDIQVILETIAAPVFRLGIAALGVIGASTHTVGNWAAVCDAAGGTGDSLAGDTLLFSPQPAVPLRPASSACKPALTGVSLVRQSPPPLLRLRRASVEPTTGCSG